jgi:hypothetical protein
MAFRDGDYIKPFLKSRGIFAKSIDNIPKGLKYPNEIKSDFSTFLSSTREISPENPVGFKGKIFLIVDDYVYSSAESFAVFAKASIALADSPKVTSTTFCTSFKSDASISPFWPT